LRYNILVNLLVLIFIMSSQKKKGFTLLELLLVIAIIAIIAAIVIVAINPARQLAQARNAQRASDLNAIYKAVQQYYIDTGNWPPPDDEIPEVLTDICWTGGGESTGCVSLDDNDDGPILVPTYLSALPQNPSGENYKIALNVGAKKIAMTAPGSREAGLLGVVLGTSTDMVLEEDDDNGGGGGGDDDPEPECSDGEDNDGDGDIDYDDGYGDPGCESDDDDSENSNINTDDFPECSDFIDNDGDGDTDYPYDNGCVDEDDDSENSDGTTWACGGSIVDARDEQRYQTIQIGSQCWMAENMNVGNMAISGDGYLPSCSSIYKYCYNDDESNCSNDGGLYTWPQTMCGSTSEGAKGICPTGWHVPTHNEFTALERQVCSSEGCITMFPYDTVTTGLRGIDEGSTLRDSGGFDAIITGFLSDEPSFMGGQTSFWTSTPNWIRTIYSVSDQIYRGQRISEDVGLSVRCILD
jgi:uncharacterized protein (TIGR02145 family)/prepilin-type N-terminal cleavage/methylation domain-containing protein